MRVICIDDKEQPPWTYPVEEGEVYTVVNEEPCPCGLCGKRVYELEEFPIDKEGERALYWTARFAVYTESVEEIAKHLEKARFFTKPEHKEQLEKISIYD